VNAGFFRHRLERLFTGDKARIGWFLMWIKLGDVMPSIKKGQKDLSQRDSGYERKERDLYETPEWVTEALLPHLPRQLIHIWEPAQGSGKMCRVLEKALNKENASITGTDIEIGGNFFELSLIHPNMDAIITNPPYELATEFVEHALRLMEEPYGLVAMLLRTDFDHAKSRSYLFRDCPAFSKKVVLMRRIAWFVEANGKPKASPSFNHAWYIWDWRHEGPPTIAYGP
jgi:hypothetical protein